MPDPLFEKLRELPNLSPEYAQQYLDDLVELCKNENKLFELARKHLRMTDGMFGRSFTMQEYEMTREEMVAELNILAKRIEKNAKYIVESINAKRSQQS